MKSQAHIHYLEVVTPDVERVCALYSMSMGASFGKPVSELGGAYTANLGNGAILGIRAPMHDAEQAVTRPYYLVDDIEKAVEQAKTNGAEIAVPPMEIPGYGHCAILMCAGVQSGLWQV